MGGTPPPTPEECAKRQKALDDCGGNIAQASRLLGIPRQTLQSWKHLQEGVRLKGTSTLYDADGNVRAEWIKTSEAALSPEDLAAQVREALEDYKPPKSFPKAPKDTEADLATVYPLSDLHVGLLSWKKETGHNYDLKIGQALIKSTLERLIGETTPSSQAVMLGLGDLLHSDNYDNQTSRSKNQLDVDGRYPKILSAATDIVLYAVDLALMKHESVLVRILPGNHDAQSAIAVTLALSLYYKNNPRVTVDDDPGLFWWWLWGKVLLGATHGDKAKMADLPLIMAARNPESWGKAKFRAIFTGHIHQDKALDRLGVKVESFQSPVAPDSWHIGQGFGTGRSLKSISYHKERGELTRKTVNIV